MKSIFTETLLWEILLGSDFNHVRIAFDVAFTCSKKINVSLLKQGRGIIQFCQIFAYFRLF